MLFSILFRLGAVLKIGLTPYIIHLVAAGADTRAAVLFGLLVLVSVFEQFSPSRRQRTITGLTDRLALVPLLVILAVREVRADPAFPILMVLGALFITVKETVILVRDLRIVTGRDAAAEPLGVRRINKLGIALAVFFYALRLAPVSHLAMIAALMISIADAFLLTWGHFKRRRGIKDLNLATQITLWRLLMSPAFLVVYFYDRNPNFADNTLVLQIIAVLFAVAFVVTDGLDGYFARKRNEVTKFGKYLDPFSDKICMLTIFLCFVASNYVPVWMVALIYYREASVSVLRTLAAAENVVIAARRSGKWKTALQGTAIITILTLATVVSEISRTGFKAEFPDIYSTLLFVWSYVPFSLMVMVTAVTLVSGLDYILASRELMEKYFK
jgi:CDP-diacylglycerol--glycerol-3-phosphate 3-phosphatidyltransferase